MRQVSRHPPRAPSMRGRPRRQVRGQRARAADGRSVAGEGYGILSAIDGPAERPGGDLAQAR